MSKIIVAGIGPGSKEDITPAVLDAVRQADVIVGYKYYFKFVEKYAKPGCECIDTGMKKERERAEQAFLLAEQGPQRNRGLTKCQSDARTGKVPTFRGSWRNAKRKRGVCEKQKLLSFRNGSSPTRKLPNLINSMNDKWNTTFTKYG